MQYEFLVLLPPLIVIILAAITKNVRVSVGVAILFSGLVVNDFSLSGAMQTIVLRFWEVTELSSLSSWATFQEASYLPICIFLLLLGVLIELIQQSGGAYAYGSFIIDKLKSAKNAQRASLLLSLIFAMDDYFSSLTVGAVMRPVTDQFRIARVKLALLVNALASPLAVLFPLSSWVGQIIGSLRQAGISMVDTPQTLIIQNPFSLYLSAIPFLFYPLLVFVSIWFLVNRGLSFGLLAKHESIAAKTGNLFAGKVSVTRQPRKGLNNRSLASVWDFLLPIFLLVFSVIWFVWNGATIFFSLFKGSLVAVVISILFLSIRGCITPRDVPHIIKQGVLLMASSVMVVVLIWTLSTLLQKDLQTGTYLASFVEGRLPVVVLPVLFFVAAVLISASMGSAWGTIGTLMPIAVPMVVSLSGVTTPVAPGHVLLLLPLVGAVISGAVSGNHLSPISDVMFMSATSAGCYHLDLVKIMVSFAIPVVIATTCSFFIVGFLLAAGYGIGITVLASLALGALINFLILSTLHWMNHRVMK